MKRQSTVDDYIERAAHWPDELRKLRAVLLATDLEETIKWGGPCYTYNGKNVVGLGSFPSYVGLWFFQGALLSDPEGVLINAQPGKTKALRQWRFTSLGDIKVRTVKAYVREAIDLQREGREIKADRAKSLVVPPQLRNAFEMNKKLEAAFLALTPGRRREYADHVAEAKRETTRLARVARITPMILAGKGLNDRYR